MRELLFLYCLQTEGLFNVIRDGISLQFTNKCYQVTTSDKGIVLWNTKKKSYVRCGIELLYSDDSE